MTLMKPVPILAIPETAAELLASLSISLITVSRANSFVSSTLNLFRRRTSMPCKLLLPLTFAGLDSPWAWISPLMKYYRYAGAGDYYISKRGCTTPLRGAAAEEKEPTGEVTLRAMPFAGMGFSIWRWVCYGWRIRWAFCLRRLKYIHLHVMMRFNLQVYQRNNDIAFDDGVK